MLGEDLNAIILDLWISSNQHPDAVSISSSTTSDVRDVPTSIQFYDFNGTGSKTHSHSYSSSVHASVGHYEISAPARSFINALLTSSKKEKNYMKTVCLNVLDNCINKFKVLSSAYKPLLGDVEIRDIIYRPLEERYHLTDEVNYDQFIINYEYTESHKFLRDVKTLTYIFQEVRDEFDVFGCSTLLDHLVTDVSKMKTDENELLEEARKQQKNLNDLDRTYKNLKSESDKEVKEIERLTGELLMNSTDEMEYAHTELSLTKKWEHARREQNSMVLRNNENSYKNVINDMEEDVIKENTVHEQIEKYLTEARTDDLNEMDNWMQQYDREIEDRDMDLLRMKHRTDLLIQEKERLQEEYKRRDQEMKEWIEYRTEKQEKEAKAALENWAAVKIQAWWRGTMFRKKLGPYRKKKKKGKNKNKRTNPNRKKRIK